MASPTRLQIAKKDIVSHFEKSPTHVYTHRAIGAVLEDQRRFWRLAQRTTIGEFIDFLVDKTPMRRVELKATHHTERLVRYVWGDVSSYELAVSLRTFAYLTHGTAVFLHGLTDLVPKTIHVNKEQSAKPPGGKLTQRGIDLAFSRKQRMSRLSFETDSFTVLIVNGKHTGRLGVERIKGPQGELLDVTDLERTLIDIVVRPAYAGGVSHVLDAYRSARERVSANKLKAMLKKLDYVYPYQQAIGFLMERAGYENSRLNLLDALVSEFDFYLTHGMKEPEYSERWRLFFPKGL